jgi:hypothetical protein
LGAEITHQRDDDVVLREVGQRCKTSRGSIWPASALGYEAGDGDILLLAVLLVMLVLLAAWLVFEIIWKGR